MISNSPDSTAAPDSRSYGATAFTIHRSHRFDGQAASAATRDPQDAVSIDPKALHRDLRPPTDSPKRAGVGSHTRCRSWPGAAVAALVAEHQLIRFGLEDGGVLGQFLDQEWCSVNLGPAYRDVR